MFYSLLGMRAELLAERALDRDGVEVPLDEPGLLAVAQVRCLLEGNLRAGDRVPAQRVDAGDGVLPVARARARLRGVHRAELLVRRRGLEQPHRDAAALVAVQRMLAGAISADLHRVDLVRRRERDAFLGGTGAIAEVDRATRAG